MHSAWNQLSNLLNACFMPNNVSIASQDDTVPHELPPRRVNKTAATIQLDLPRLRKAAALNTHTLTELATGNGGDAWATVGGSGKAPSTPEEILNQMTPKQRVVAALCTSCYVIWPDKPHQRNGQLDDTMASHYPTYLPRGVRMHAHQPQTPTVSPVPQPAHHILNTPQAMPL